MENKEGRNSLLWLIVFVIGVSLFIYFNFGSEIKNWMEQSASDNPTIDIKPNATVGATKINVGTFYNGQEGYSISIPSGNRSTCIWNWTGGSGAIPDSATTNAETATEKHTMIYYPGSTYDYKVNCFDDFGNQYVGVFPAE